MPQCADNMADDVKFQTFPGFDLIDDEMYLQIENCIKDLKHNIRKFGMLFGSNDASKAARNSHCSRISSVRRPATLIP